MSSESTPVEVFYSYAHEDEKLRDELKKHLANLKRQSIITDWYDRDISAGKEWDGEIKKHLDSARVILLLISPDFMNSDYSNDVEVRRAMERHEAGEARVIPIILRPVDWKGAPFSRLHSLPSDVRPITLWENSDEAFVDVTQGIRKTIAELSGPSAHIPTLPDIPRPPRVGFIGRRDQDGRDIVERLRSELAPEKNQLVALWGPGGVGKTALAAEAVRSLIEISGQRIVWTTADGRINFTLSTLLDDIAEQLGRIDLRPLAVAQKEEALRPIIANAPTLIVLDNFETIVPEEESLCRDFLAKSAHCSALITTRERIENTYLIPLAAMSSEEANIYLDKLIQQTHEPDIYAIVDRNRILMTADFNPLILQWIVAQIDLAQDPDEVLSDLSRGEGDAAERVFDRSFNLPQMADGGRAVLLALSLFMPSATRPALAEVAAMNTEKNKKRFRQSQQTLGSLWLVKQTDGGQRLAVEGLTRELTRARLAHDPRFGRFRERYLSRFLEYTKVHLEHTVSNLNALENEIENILGAIDIASESRLWKELMYIVSVIAPTNGFLGVRGYWDEAIRRNEQAKDAAISVNDETYTGLFLLRAGNFRGFRGEYDAAHMAYDTALSIFKRLGDEKNTSAALHNLATLAHDRGAMTEARKLYNASLRIDRKLGGSDGIATCLRNLGMLAHDEGRIAKARRLYNESLGISRSIGDTEGIASCLHSLATVAQNQERIEEASDLYNESLELSRRRGDRSGTAASLYGLGTVAVTRGDIEDASKLLNESLKIARELGDLRIIAYCLRSLGRLSLNQKDYEEAKKLLAESLIGFRKLNFAADTCDCLKFIGDVSIAEKDLLGAKARYREALQIANALGDKLKIASLKSSLRSARSNTAIRADPSQ